MEEARKELSISEYERHKQRLHYTRENIIPRILAIDKKKAESMLTCGQVVYVCDCAQCRASHFAGSSRCRSRFCLECAHYRSLAYVAKMMERIVPLLDEGCQAHMLTMTIRDGDNLQERIDRLRSAWRTVHHDDKTVRKKFKSRFIAGFRTFEVKIGRGSGKWHPHMHAFVMTPPGEFERDYDWFQPAWKYATSGEGSIEVHKIKARSGQAFGILKAVIEVVKYVTSPDKMTITVDDDKFEEMYWVLKGFRAVNSWGRFRGIVQEAEDEAGKPYDEKKLAGFICRLCGCSEAVFRAVWAEALRDTLLFDM